MLCNIYWIQFVRGNFISTAGDPLVTTVCRVSIMPLQSLNCLLSTSTAHSNCVLTFPNNTYRHACYCLSSVKQFEQYWLWEQSWQCKQCKARCYLHIWWYFLQIVHQLKTKIIMFKMTMAKMFATRPPQTVPTWWQGIQVPTFNCLPKTSSSSPPIPVSSIKGWVHRRKNIEIFTIWGVNHDKIKQRKKGQCHGEGGVWRMSQFLRCLFFWTPYLRQSLTCNGLFTHNNCIRTLCQSKLHL